MSECGNIGTGKRRYSDAFTIIELVVTMLIASIVATISIQALVSASTLYAASVASRQLETDVSLAMDRFIRETRLISSANTNPVVADTGTNTFVNQDGALMRFERSGTNLLLNGNLLLAGVQTFAISYYDSANGLLSNSAAPYFPLNLGMRRRVRAVGVNLSASSGGQVETLKTYVFWPTGGTRR